METKIIGTVMPVLELSMQPNDKVFAEAGQLAWMSMALQMQTSTSAGGQQAGVHGRARPGDGRRHALHDRIHSGWWAGTARVRRQAAWPDPADGHRVELHGDVVTYDLQPGNTLRVHPGHVGMYEESVGFNIMTVPGIQNAFFGGSGLFLAALTGPGRVWLQSMTMQHLAHAIQEYLPKPG